jgi:hypothetical protein
MTGLYRSPPRAAPSSAQVPELSRSSVSWRWDVGRRPGTGPALICARPPSPEAVGFLQLGDSERRLGQCGRICQGSRLDYVALSENDRLVRDIRLPGDKEPRSTLYTCDVCGFSKWATRPPKCPNGHGRMSG